MKIKIRNIKYKFPRFLGGYPKDEKWYRFKYERPSATRNELRQKAANIDLRIELRD